MKAVAPNGSPRKGGNTEILLKKALAPLAAAGWETEFIQFSGTPIRPPGFANEFAQTSPVKQ